MGNYSEDPQIFLSDAISNSYVGVRFQQGKPILDRELNLLGDLSSPQRLARPYIGNGVPDGSDGFRIGNLTVDNDEFDFTIGRGRCIVNGYEVELKEDTTFKRQKNYNRDGLVQPRPGETKYEVHLRVFTKEISYTEDLDLENRDDIGFETTRRLQADWEVIVGTSVLFDASMTDLFLLAEIDTGSLQVTDRRTTRLTVSKIRRDLDQLTDKTASMSQILNVNTLSVRDTLGVGFTSTSEAPSVTPTIQAAQTAANAAEAAAISLNALVKAASAEGVAAATDTMNSLNAKASQAYDAAIAAKAAALDAAVPSRTPSEVSRSATSAADQTRLAGQRAQEAATLGNQIATALSPEKATQANSIRTAATDSDAKGKAAVTAADTAKREADNLDSAVAGYNLTRTIQASAKFAVNGDSYLQGNLTTTGKLGLGTMNAPTEKLQIDGGSIFINGENTGLIVDATGAKRVGFIKYASREAGIWRASAQDFEIGRVDASVNALPGSPNAFTTDLYIQGDGKVGINTTNPGSRLTVSSSASHLQLRREATETTGGSQMFLELFQDDSNPAKVPEVNPFIRFHHGWRYWYRLEAASTGFHFKMGDTSDQSHTDIYALAGRFAGLVGVGTQAPESNLHVNAAASATPVGAMSVDAASFVTNDNAKASYFFRVRDIGANSTPFLIRGDGNVGIGTTDPYAKLEVKGAANIWGGDGRYAVTQGHMAAGSLTLGSTKSNYGGGKDWNKNTAGLLLETLDNTEIAVHDSGTRITSLMYYEGDKANRITIGRDMGWGTVGQVAINGNVGLGAGTPGARLTIQQGATDAGKTATGKALFISGNMGEGVNFDGGIEFRHDNLTQGIGFGYNTIYATGTNDNQPLMLQSQLKGTLNLNPKGGNVVVGSATTPASLEVSARITTQQFRIAPQSFKMPGDLGKYYPVIFFDDGWHDGFLELEIFRPNTHTDAQWRGALMSRFTCHSNNWGHGADFMHAEFHQTQRKFIASFKTAKYGVQFIIWLEGGNTYYWSANHPVILSDYAATEKSIADEKFSIKTTVDAAYNVNDHVS